MNSALGCSIPFSGDNLPAYSAAGAGTVTSVSVTPAAGVSGTVATATTTPAITIVLGNITPTSVNTVVISGASTPTLTVTGTTAVSGINTGDQTEFPDNTFRVIDNVDPTKKVALETSTITTATTRTLTVPNENGTIVLDTATQILTNKTITTPIISTPTINLGMVLTGSTSGTVTITPTAITTSYPLVLPPAQGSGLLSNDGSGNLSWGGTSGITGWTPALDTSAPNATVNVSLFAASGGTTNQDAVIQPKGTGAFILQLPDNTVTGGNKRGTYAVDLQTNRSVATAVASGNYSFTGGYDNTATNSAAVALGNTNIASGQSSVAIGELNVATGQGSVAMGMQNTAGGINAAIALGKENVASGENSTIAGGFQNTASGDYSAILGGATNVNAGAYSVVMGQGLTFTSAADNSFGFHSNPSLAFSMTIAAPNTSVFGNVNMWLANNDNTARELRFYEPYNTTGAFPNTANYTAFKAGVQSADITYTLPTADGTSGNILSTNGTGTLSWIAPTGGTVTTVSVVTANGVSGTVATATSTPAITLTLAGIIPSLNVAAPNNTVNASQILANGGTTNQDLVLQPKGTGSLLAQLPDGTTAGGDKRGTNSVDWQTYRTVATYVTAGDYSVIGGGGDNYITGQYNTIAGGTGNYIQSTATGGAIAGGINNKVRDNYGFAANSENYADGYSSVALGHRTTVGDKSFSFSGTTGNVGSGTRTDVSALYQMFFTHDVNLAIGNVDSVAREIQLYSPNSSADYTTNAFYTAFKAGVQAASVTYTLPIADGTSGYILSTNGTGTLSWIPPGAGGDMLLAGVQTVTGAKTFGSAGAVGKLIIAGSTSGSTILDATAVAGAGTVTLPTTGTLATLAGTETLTNKTLTAPIVSGTTNINTSGSAATSINTGTSTGAVAIGNSVNTGGINLTTLSSQIAAFTYNPTLNAPSNVFGFYNIPTTGTPLNGFGTRVNYYANTDVGSNKQLGSHKWTWSDVTDATATSKLELEMSNGGTVGTYFTFNPGSIGIKGSTSGVMTMAVGSTITTHTITFPSDNAAGVLTNNGSGALSWSTPSAGDMTLAGIQTVTGAKTFGSAGAVGKLIIAGSTSGSTILDATAVAGAGTVTLPTTGTLATLAGTETLSNKTLVAPALGTPASGVMTNVTGTAASLTSGKATNIVGGLGGQIHYQSAVDTTALLANGTSGQVLTSAGTTLAPTWTTPTTGDMTLAGVQTVTGAKTFGSAGAVGKLIIAGSTSGTTILDATAVAGSGTVTLPTTGTLATLAGTETLSNKTLVAPALGTPASGVMTNVTGTAASLTSGKATNIVGGLGGSIPYQSAVDTTALLANGTSGQLLTSSGGTSAPTWTTVNGLTGYTASLNTSSPNNVINASLLLASGGTTNQDAVISPKGTGAFLLQMADSTSTGGNKRGTYAFDAQMSRSSASQVASGNYSFTAGSQNTASGSNSVAMGNFNEVTNSNGSALGQYNTVTGESSFAAGNSHTVSGERSAAIGFSCSASGVNSIAMGSYGVASYYNQIAFGGGSGGQSSLLHARNTTTNTTQTELFLDNSSIQLGVPSDKTYAFEIRVTGRRTDTPGSSYHAVIEGTISNNSGTTALDGSNTLRVITNTAGTWSAVAEADNTNDALVVKVTGASGATIRWVAAIKLVEVAS